MDKEKYYHKQKENLYLDEYENILNFKGNLLA